MDAENRTPQTFPVDGIDHPVPDFDSINLREAMALEGYGVQLADIGPDSTVTVSILAGLMHVAVTRKNLDISATEARAIVERQKLLAVLEGFVGEEEDADPLAGTALDSQSGDSSINSIGGSSSNGSDASQETAPSRTGQLRPATLPASDPATSST